VVGMLNQRLKSYTVTLPPPPQPQAEQQ
jgi:hypothetical protein